jgi:hypothetical protein
MLVIGSTVDEPEIVSVPVTGATEGPEDAAEDSAGDPVFEQAARTITARIPARAGRTRVGWVNAVPPTEWTLVRLEDPGSGLTDAYRYMKAV